MANLLELMSKCMESPTHVPNRAGGDADLGADVWGIVGVAQLGGDVEPELLVVLHCGVTQPDTQCTTLQAPDVQSQRGMLRVRLDNGICTTAHCICTHIADHSSTWHKSLMCKT